MQINACTPKPDYRRIANLMFFVFKHYQIKSIYELL